jgi:hypothetical protein
VDLQNCLGEPSAQQPAGIAEFCFQLTGEQKAIPRRLYLAV